MDAGRKPEASAVRRILWLLLRGGFGAWGTRWVCNDQYRRGYWDYITKAKSEETVAYVREYLCQGHLVEFGCGEGVLPNILGPDAYSSYVGIDISEVAIERARAKRIPRCSFEVGRLEDWPGGKDISVCLVEEVIYYLSPREQRSFLERCIQSLTPGGAVIVIVYNPSRYAAPLEIARSCGHVTEDRIVNGRGIVIIGANP